MTGQVICKYCGVVANVVERKCQSCGAPLPIITSDAEANENSFEGNIAEQMREICAGYEEIESCHTKETIPENKLRNAKAAFEIAEEDKVIMVYDGTVFGNNKLGFAICESGIYWKNDWTTPTKRTCLAWEEYKERKIKIKKKDLYISLGWGDKIAILDEEELKALGNLLKDIQALLWESSSGKE